MLRFLAGAIGVSILASTSAGAAEPQPLYIARVVATSQGSQVLSSLFLLRPFSSKHLINSTAPLDAAAVGALTDVANLIIVQGPQAEETLAAESLFTVESANGSGVVATPRGARLVQYGQGYKPDITQAQLDALLKASETISVAGFDFHIYCPAADQVTIELHPASYGQGEAVQSLNSPLLRIAKPLATHDLGLLNREGEAARLGDGS